MATDFERALISSIIQEKDIRTVVKQKITPDFFSSPMTRAAFVYLLQWYRNPAYKDTPSLEAFQDAFPSFELTPVDDSITSLCDQVRATKLLADIADSIQDIGNICQGDSLRGFEALKKHASRLTAMHTVDDATDVRTRVDEIKAEYERMKHTEGEKLKGRPYPWPALNRATLGLQDGQLVMLYGRPKSGKTWALLEILRTVHQAGAKVHLFSQELSDIEMARRIVCMECCIPYSRFLLGELNPDEEKEFDLSLEAFIESPPIILDMLTTVGEEALIELKAKMDESGATVGAIDAMNVLGNDVKEIVAVTRGTKRFAKHSRIPMLGTTQRLRPKGKADSYGGQSDGSDVYGSDSYLQDCDLLLMIERLAAHKKANEQLHTTVAIREGTYARYTTHFFLCSDLTQKEELKAPGEEDEEEMVAKLDEADDGGDTRAE